MRTQIQSRIQKRNPRSPLSPISPISPQSSFALNQTRGHGSSPFAFSEDQSAHFTLSQSNEDSLLLQKGYKITKKISNTSQTELFQGIRLMDQTTVVVKKMHKLLFTLQFAKAGEIAPVIEQDILKEATILYYLTVDNTPTAHYISKYIDLVESEHYYYLITEYEDKTIHLKQFIRTAQQYITSGKLRRKQYNKSIKYIFWQIFVLMRWLHVDMHCCHLNLRLENVMLENVAFIMRSDGTMSVSSSVSIKICGFGRSEVFKTTCDEGAMYKCDKAYDVRYEESCYDARSADIWSLGSMLYHCYSGGPLLPGYSALTSGKLKRYLVKTCATNSKMIDLLCKLLKPDESNTLDMMDVLQHPCFKMYYQKYKKRIAEKARTQRLRLMKQKDVLRSLPYYNIDKKVSFV
eukprot:49882_1